MADRRGNHPPLQTRVTHHISKRRPELASAPLANGYVIGVDPARMESRAIHMGGTNRLVFKLIESMSIVGKAYRLFGYMLQSGFRFCVHTKPETALLQMLEHFREIKSGLPDLIVKRADSATAEIGKPVPAFAENALQHVPEKLTDFSDENMLQLFDFERALADGIVGGDCMMACQRQRSRRERPEPRLSLRQRSRRGKVALNPDQKGVARCNWPGQLRSI